MGVYTPALFQIFSFIKVYMISIKAIKNFILTNSILIFFGIIQYIGLTLLTSFSPIIQFLLTFFLLLIRNFSFVYLIGIAVKNKKYVSNSRKEPVEQYKGEFILNVITTTLMDAITTVIAKQYLLHNIKNHLWYLLMFIPLSFVFELVFDFFHYWAHRIAHTNKYLYKYLHKKHHKFHDVIPIVTFYQDMIDVFVSNTIPALITLYLMSQFVNLSIFWYSIMTVYKVSVEIYGHSGKYTSPEFVQCIWLPKYLNIVLTSEDHSHHHMYNNCNYSKRFSLWDKLFGTFRTKN